MLTIFNFVDRCSNVVYYTCNIQFLAKLAIYFLSNHLLLFVVSFEEMSLFVVVSGDTLRPANVFVIES